MKTWTLELSEDELIALSRACCFFTEGEHSGYDAQTLEHQERLYHWHHLTFPR